MTKYLVTGAAGFIGSHLVDRLLELGHTVIGVDKKQIAECHHLYQHRDNPNFIYKYWNFAATDRFFLSIDNDVDTVFHLAANADVRHGFEDTRKDLENNTIATYNVLEAMRKAGIKKIVFASTAAIYGDIGNYPDNFGNYPYFGKLIPENCSIPIQTSLYGASKLACEGLIQAYSAGFGIKYWIYRFSSIIGERYSHGFIYDFYKQLKKDPTKLYVVGGKRQQKSYLYVKDCIDGILKGINVAPFLLGSEGYIFNLGHKDIINLTESIPIITRYLGINPTVTWSGKSVGWTGDSMICHLDIGRMNELGWTSTVSIPEGIILTLKWLQENEWILEQRGDL